MVQVHLLCTACGSETLVDLTAPDGAAPIAVWVASHHQPRLAGAMVTVDGQHLSALRYARPVRLG